MKKILIVEDDTFLQGLAATKLMKDGYTVVSSSTEEEACKLLDKDTPDAVVLDLLLPGGDGYSVLKKIRENLKMLNTPVIVFSNLSEPQDIKKAKDMGATEFMVKSNFTLDELSDKIKTFLK
jgi:DNA-binding response OmpR family regulator